MGNINKVSNNTYVIRITNSIPEKILIFEYVNSLYSTNFYLRTKNNELKFMNIFVEKVGASFFNFSFNNYDYKESTINWSNDYLIYILLNNKINIKFNTESLTEKKFTVKNIINKNTNFKYILQQYKKYKAFKNDYLYFTIKHYFSHKKYNFSIQ